MVTTTEEALRKFPHLVKENRRLNRWKREALVVLDEWDSVWKAAGRPGKLGESIALATATEVEHLKRFNQRLMEELSKYGWGDFHYGHQDQDPNIVALLQEGGFTKKVT